MKITYLYHSGVIVELSSHILIFDYWKGKLPKLPCDKTICVFVSHAHDDHYQPAIFKLLSYCRDVTYIFAQDILAPFPYYACGKNETHYIKDLKVTTFASNDEGVAFLVSVEGKQIYHSGDLHLWNWPCENESDRRFLIWQRQVFEEAMQKLHDCSIDVAFYPIDPRLETQTLDGIYAFRKAVFAKHVIAIHFADRIDEVKAMIAQDPLLQEDQGLHVLMPNESITL